MKIICEIFNSKGERIRSVPVNGKSIIIGRDTSAGIKLEDQRVSRKHARVEFSSRGWIVTDLNSTNGTYLNNQPLTATEFFTEKDTLRVGSHSLRFCKAESSPAEIPQTALVLAATLSSDGKERLVETLPLYICFNRESGKMALTSDPYHPDNMVKVMLTAQGFVIHNMFEKDFVYLNGRPFTKAMLKSGDTVRIGNQNCLLELKSQVPTDQFLSEETQFSGTAKKRGVWKWLVAAAVLILILGLTGYGYYRFQLKPENPYTGLLAVLEDSLNFQIAREQLFRDQQNLRDDLSQLSADDSLAMEFESQLELLRLDSYFLSQVNISREAFADTVKQFLESRRWLLLNAEHSKTCFSRLDKLDKILQEFRQDSTHNLLPEQQKQINELSAASAADTLFADSLLMATQRLSESLARLNTILARENSGYVQQQWLRYSKNIADQAGLLYNHAKKWRNSLQEYLSQIRQFRTVMNKLEYRDDT